MADDGGEELGRPSKNPVRIRGEGTGAPGELQPPRKGGRMLWPRRGPSELKVSTAHCPTVRERD